MHVYVYVYVCVYVFIHMCMSVYMYSYTFIYARVCVYICTRVGAFCLFVLSNFSVHARVSQVFLNTRSPACVCVGGLEVGFVSACSWFALVTGVGGYVLTGVEIGGLSCIFLYLCGC